MPRKRTHHTRHHTAARHKKTRKTVHRGHAGRHANGRFKTGSEEARRCGKKGLRAACRHIGR